MCIYTCIVPPEILHVFALNQTNDRWGVFEYSSRGLAACAGCECRHLRTHPAVRTRCEFRRPLEQRSRGFAADWSHTGRLIFFLFDFDLGVAVEFGVYIIMNSNEISCAIYYVMLCCVSMLLLWFLCHAPFCCICCVCCVIVSVVSLCLFSQFERVVKRTLQGYSHGGESFPRLI